ncbi:MAG: type II secretion system minor pseudopilin GspK [Parerythrobacter sp.]
MTNPPSKHTRTWEREAGMVLINVLVIVMLATALLAVMIARDDSDIELTIRLRQAAEANAVLRGGELSAIAALRRDLARDNAADGLDEEWAGIADRDAAIDGGRFTFAVFDAQAKFNLNNLRSLDARTRQRFAAIAANAELPVETVDRIAEYVRAAGYMDDLSDLAALGLAPEQIRSLTPYATVLPEPTPVNLNTASQEVLVVMLGSLGSAQSVAALRERQGTVSRSDLMSVGLSPPSGTGLTSRYYWASGEVKIGGTRQRLTSLLYRRSKGGGPEVLALKRWRGAAPLQVPPLSQ